MHCLQLEPAQTELVTLMGHMALLGGKLGQLETEIPVMRCHISLILRYQPWLHWIVFYVCKHCAQRFPCLLILQTHCGWLWAAGVKNTACGIS